jgi:hypothetical protein
LRLMGIAAVNASKDTRTKLHSLSVLSGTMLKALALDGDNMSFGSSSRTVNTPQGN